ncbi:MAG: hypothetical protein A4E45_00438 [Methanosaeta sp. PtaB.Bin039]|nr:MAG: hypothetical protein A4E45_00438 [Methanosaeta sp. PtaB.Bin039]OPY46999.1 MAG: hypothetical protein A4E47_00392 [Methanosaeta sp. PtaU1.Bin028]HOT07077.1 GlsB/YeaQ/YmgE family stress response membrane protein [Methanotrichaceae archaeon]HQF17088.1 GlsB/YeaQ/YmgE family stress response membrane protein [Methanotrichaceae archaeon]HQI91709.1 GlsB/YeaQ/YmgE family stress response membrane protein [Methanotrichaceae archaeon]
MFEFIGWLIIGVLAGWLAGKLMRGRGFGLIGNLLVGVVGAAVGGLIFGILGLSSHGTVGSLVTATAGAVVLLFVVGYLKRM